MIAGSKMREAQSVLKGSEPAFDSQNISQILAGAVNLMHEQGPFQTPSWNLKASCKVAPKHAAKSGGMLRPELLSQPRDAT
jgi:hypothetical protein